MVINLSVRSAEKIRRKLAFVCFLLSIGTVLPCIASASDASCSTFKAVYAPYPEYERRSRGNHYRMTIEDEDCTPPLCPAAKVYLNTYDNTDILLSRLTMHYGCAGGDGRSCYVSFSKDKLSTKPSEKKWDHIQFKVTALTSDFNETSFLGSNGNIAARALIFSGMPLRFLFPLIDWSEYKKSIQFFSKSAPTPEMAPDEFAPETWVISKCNQ